MSQYVQVYKNINTRITIGSFTVNELLLPFATFAMSTWFRLGLVENVIAIGISIYLMVILKELNETKIRGFYSDFIWWHGLTRGEYKNYPPSYAREFVA